jgi:hypothetical protein
MAEYIKFRLTAAKVGVSMAFLALLGGLADKSKAASQSAGAHVLRQISLPTGGGLDRIVIQKLDTALLKIENKLASAYFTAQKIDSTFLKIKSADSSFLKIKSANTDFLKIDDANSNFLKIDDANTDFLKIDNANSEFLKIDSANSEFLKIDDANTQFLKATGTAANSSELGGLAPDAFVQGKGTVVSGFASVTAANNVDKQVPLIASPDGAIAVLVFIDSGTVTLAVQNKTTSDLPAVQDTNGTPQTHTLIHGESTPFVISQGASESTIQIFPAGSSTDVITLTVGVDPVAGAATGVVAQMLVGSSS